MLSYNRLSHFTPMEVLHCSCKLFRGFDHFLGSTALQRLAKRFYEPYRDIPPLHQPVWLLETLLSPKRAEKQSKLLVTVLRRHHSAGLKEPYIIFTNCFGLQENSLGTTLKACLHCVNETIQPFSQGRTCDFALEKAFRVVVKK